MIKDWSGELQTIKERLQALESMRIQCSYPLFAKRVGSSWVIGATPYQQSGGVAKPLIRVVPEYPGAVVAYETSQPVGVASGAWFPLDKRTAYSWTSGEASDQELLVVWRQALSFNCAKLRVRFIAMVSGAGAEVVLKKVYDTEGNDTGATPSAVTSGVWSVSCVKLEGTFRAGGLVTLVWGLKAKNGATAYLADAELSASSLSVSEEALW